MNRRVKDKAAAPSAKTKGTKARIRELLKEKHNARQQRWTKSPRLPSGEPFETP